MALENNQINNDEISLKELIIKIKKQLAFLRTKYLLILSISLLSSLIVLIHIKLKPLEFNANLTFAMDEDRGGSIGGAMNLASQLGIDLGSAGSGGLFSGPNIIELIKSKLIVKKTLLLTVVDLNNSKETLINYYINKKISLKKMKNNNINFSLNSNLDSISREQDSIINIVYNEILNNNLTVLQKDKKISIVNIDVKSNNEIFSKIFCESIAKITSDFYIKIKSEKSKINVEILQKQVDSVQNELKNTVLGVANLSDNVYNLNPSFLTKSTPSKLKQVEATINAELLKQLIANLEIAKMNLRKETPLIQILDSPRYPLDIKNPNIFFFSILSFLATSIFISILLIVNKELKII
jgi:hypothetical protein